jgi:hypothetical protein
MFSTFFPKPQINPTKISVWHLHYRIPSSGRDEVPSCEQSCRGKTEELSCFAWHNGRSFSCHFLTILSLLGFGILCLAEEESDSSKSISFETSNNLILLTIST